MRILKGWFGLLFAPTIAGDSGSWRFSNTRVLIAELSIHSKSTRFIAQFCIKAPLNDKKRNIMVYWVQ
jgi:hypothetical protein